MARMRPFSVIAPIVFAAHALMACGGSHTELVGDGGLRAWGDVHTGQYNLGPVEWSGSFNNACSPYPSSIETLEGDMLAGLSNEVASAGDYCDACIYMETDAGRNLILRVVTYGVSKGAGDVDLSQEAFSVLSAGEYPRSMSWQLVQCPTVDPLWFQFQTQASQYWTSLWVRNPAEKVDGLEVQSPNHSSWFALTRGTDGTFTDSSGFGSGNFSLKVTGDDGETLTQSFGSFSGGSLLQGTGNLP
jgi:expansin (peptidoglycan-binding protein)